MQLARLSFIEAVRNRIAYGVLVFLAVLLATAALISSVTMGRTQMLILDLGLSGISILGNLMAMLFAIQSLQQERDSRALYVLLIRLPRRWHYVLGKFAGLAAVLVGGTLFYIGFTGLEPILPSLVSKSGPESAYGTSLGAYNSMQFLGSFAGGSIAGALARYPSTYIMGTLIFASVVGFLLMLLRPQA